MKNKSITDLDKYVGAGNLETTLQEKIPVKQLVGQDLAVILDAGKLKMFPAQADKASRMPTLPMVEANEGTSDQVIEPTPSPFSTALAEHRRGMRQTTQERRSDKIRDGKNLPTIFLPVSSGAFLAIIALKKPDTRKDIVHAQNASITMFFFATLLSIVTLLMDLVVHQPSFKVYRGFNITCGCLLVVGFMMIFFSSICS